MPTLYAIQGELTGHVKIGRTIGVLNRLRTLQASSPDRLHLIATDPRGRYESALHVLWSKYRLHGEWFSHHVGTQIATLGLTTIVDRLTLR